MRIIALIILVGAFVRHCTSFWWGDLIGVDARVVFYVLGGFWEFVLAGVIAYLAWKKPYFHIIAFGCFMFGTEGLQMGICRIFAEGGRGNICDVATGLPVGATLTALYNLNVCYFSRMDMRKFPMPLIPLIASADVSYQVHPFAGVALLATSYAVWRCNERKL